MLRENSQQVFKKWKLINFRTVNDLLTAEFLHDLYNRHQPEVNSIRFRNTLCVLRGQDFRSYAPQDEWNYLGEQLGRRFYYREARLFKEVAQYINKEKKNLNSFLSSLPSDFSTTSNEELFSILSQFHYLALGDIYGINLVQIEHALKWAISKHLLNNPKDFSALPRFEWESQLRVFENALIESSLQISEENRPFEEVFRELCEEFGHFMNGYGSGVNAIEKIKHRLANLLSIDLEKRKKILIPEEGRVSDIPSEYADLYEVASKIAELRDKNKLLMGYVTSKRNAVLEMIANRKHLTRSEISRYALLEINNLIYENERLPLKTIQDRHHLVVFKREESFYTNVRAEAFVREFFEASCGYSDSRNKMAYGTIASKGIVRGKARIVFSHKDCEFIKKTDILVALGTDFDLLHAIALCAGVVTEEGGILSHASVVSRELGKPCLIGVAHLLSFIQEGDWVLLNCDEGYLKIENSPEIDLPVGMKLLHEDLEESQFPPKIVNLNRVARGGFLVPHGICIHSSFKGSELGDDFFKILHKICVHFLRTNTLIMRGCASVEDQKESSFAGASCSRVINNEFSSLKSAFYEVKYRNVKSEDSLILENSILIQPFVHFEYGGVAFTDNSSRKVLVEVSAEGPFGVVNGKVDQRMSFDMEQCHQEAGGVDTSGRHLCQVALAAYKIAQLFGYDVDIEWGSERGNFWVLQARPVTIPCVS